MKIFVHHKGIVVVGKCWEVRAKLKEYSQKYYLLKDWVQSVNS